MAKGKRGSLMVVGSGIKSVGHITLEAQGWIRQADRVLYCVADPATVAWIQQTNPNSEDLGVFYGDGKRRGETYREMTRRILECVRSGLDVCVVLYGHPGVFVNPSHEAIRLAREEGYRAGMLPAVSALDCLFADLGVDPASAGCQTFDATDVLVHRRRLDTTSHIILWQIAALGDPGFSRAGYDAHHLPVLVAELARIYGPDYEVVLYQAATYAVCSPSILKLPLSRLRPALIASASTLYIPPKDAPLPDAEMFARLGLNGASTSGTAVPVAERASMPSEKPVIGGRLAGFISSLSQDPRLLARFFRDPRRTVERYGGLTEAECAAALSGRPGRIQQALMAAPSVPSLREGESERVQA